MKCSNCKMEFTGVTCTDKDQNPICFTCWLWSKGATSDVITCPKCYGIGKHTKGFVNMKLTNCKVCNGSGHIQKADIETVALPIENKIQKPIVNFEECPF